MEKETNIPSKGVIQQRTVHDLPKGAIFIDDNKMIELQMDIARKWKPSHQMWAVTHGWASMASLAAISGVVFSTILRKKFKLRNQGASATLLPSVVLPAFSTFLSQGVFVLEPMFLGREQCPMCLELRAMNIQLLFGWFQPLILSGVACLVVAKSSGLHPLPHVTHVRKHVTLIYDYLRPHKFAVASLFAINAMAALYLTREQAKSASLVHHKMSTNRNEHDE